MREWFLTYDYVAAFMLLIIILWYFCEKRIPLRNHIVFFVLIFTSFLSDCMEIIVTQMAMTGRYQNGITFCMLSVQKLIFNLIPVIFVYYVLSLAHVDAKKHPFLKHIYIFAVILDFIIYGSNIFTHWVMHVEGDIWVRGIGSFIIYGIDLCLLVIGFVSIVRHANRFSFLRPITILINVLICVVAGVVEVQLKIPMLHLAIAFLCLSLFFYLQNEGNKIDAVTNQFNRSVFGEYVESCFKKEKKFAVIAVAMDDFKFINKTYGVENGDNLLRQVSMFFESLRVHKYVFRLGSDNFCIVLGKDIENASLQAQIIEERFKHPWFSDSHASIMMSASICCASCPRDAGSLGELIEVLDYSMSVAKKTNKGKITLVEDIDLGKIKMDKAVERAVKVAMDRDELIVHYQPIYSVEKNGYNSAEALVRLNDNKLGWISPETFIPIAEKNGLIVEMGEMILEKVCRFIRDSRLMDSSIEYIEVNISPLQLVQIDFAERVQMILEKYNVSPKMINMEVTETATMGNSETIMENVRRLVDYGIRFSLDDYGSGHANIDYINRMPFSIIKIDKVIIWDAFKDDKAGITLKYTIGMLNALNLSIVAEGVETVMMRDRLIEHGCHYMQGWYYSKAVAEEEFVKLIGLA